MVLYEKVMIGQRTTYREYVPPDNSMHEIEHEQMVTLLATLTISMVMSIESQLPDHTKFARELKLLEQAIVRFAKLNAKPLDDVLVSIGCVAWNKAISTMQQGLAGQEVS